MHVFEHLWPWKVEEILARWYKILIPGGKLIMEMPDLNKILEHFKTKPLNMRMTLFALYGGEQSERIEDLHKFCWNYETLAPLLEKVGFKCEEQRARFHIPERDFIIQGTK